MTRRSPFPAFAALLIWAFSATLASSEERNLLTVTLAHLPAQAGERIVAIEVSIAAGGVYRLDHLPMGWNFVVDNDPSWQTTVKGNIEIGAAAVDSDYFRAFMIVRRFEYSNLKFELRGRVLVTKDFLHERWISLSEQDFDVQPKRDAPH
jgi:hypothetical protein